MAERAGMIDSWANAFLPDREALWDASLEAQGVPIKVRRDPEDSFCDAGTMVERMDAIGLQTLVLPVCDLPPHAGVTDFEGFATRVEEIESIVSWATPVRLPSRKTSLPARCSCHSIFASAASSTRRAAEVTSGPIPSPGIRVTGTGFCAWASALDIGGRYGRALAEKIGPP